MHLNYFYKITAQKSDHWIKGYKYFNTLRAYGVAIVISFSWSWKLKLENFNNLS